MRDYGSAEEISKKGKLVYEVTGIPGGGKRVLLWVGSGNINDMLTRREPVEYYLLGCWKGLKIRAYHDGIDITDRLSTVAMGYIDRVDKLPFVIDNKKDLRQKREI